MATNSASGHLPGKFPLPKTRLPRGGLVFGKPFPYHKSSNTTTTLVCKKAPNRSASASILLFRAVRQQTADVMCSASPRSSQAYDPAKALISYLAHATHPFGPTAPTQPPTSPEPESRPFASQL